jgi:hypothetical protein
MRRARDQRFFAALFLRAVVFLRVAEAFRVPRFRVAAAFLPAAIRFVDFRRAGLRAVVFLRAVAFFRAGLRAAVFLRAGLRAAVFLAAVFLRVVVRLRVAAAFFAAVFRRAVVRLRVAAAFLAAADRLAAGRFRAAVFRAAIPVPLSSVDNEGSCAYDAIRLRRRRSRSLIPPHTPYRSSRRSA